MLEIMKPVDSVQTLNMAGNQNNSSGNIFLTASNVLSESMKHPVPYKEENEFNLGRALDLRCVSGAGFTVCGECESCLLTRKIREFREWFARFGDHSKKRFMLGLLRRMRSIDLLKHFVSLLQPTLNKDCTYSRSRTNPSLDTDSATVSSDRAMSGQKVEQVTISTWEWFTQSSYWTKANFSLNILQMCEAHLLHTLHTQARTLLASEMKAADANTEDDIYEAASVLSTEHSHHSEDHPELELLSQSRLEYCPIAENPFTGQQIQLPKSRSTFSGDQSLDSESISDTASSSVDPMILVMPQSAKAYAGVARHKDFIRCLPVHLAKMILSMLDMATLFNALCVSPNWRKLVEEVRVEFRVNQQLKEEVMLMQGAAAHGANPLYANDIDVLVPCLEPGTRDVIYTEDDVIKTTFKSEINWETAYSGVKTQKVIMEERNVYCGAYNVMVVVDNEDSHRVMHTDGSELIALGSLDRKVRFIDSATARETGPVITGHAGSVRCVHLLRDRGMVLSGSYDTSVRCWSVETGQCLKILRGHQDTVVTLAVCGDVVATGAKDKHCKIWSLETAKCQKTFKHRAPISAVALSEEICISGCEAGKVKVWELSSGNLIKTLSGHHSAVTGIKFDRWHIVTGSRDGYALCWSALGRHSRCLAALRHPKEVLCIEFLYLRVITGSADGRLRVWNMVTGQCCRIMRGNSRSDPILSVIAIGDRITVNTLNNLLVMNFEKVTWDYSLETDKVPPLVQYGSYSDAPVRQQPYSYIRAQRMRLAGASNYKIVHHDEPPAEANTKLVLPQHKYRALQLPHSAKTLSQRSLEAAKRAQSASSRPDICPWSPDMMSMNDSPRQEVKYSSADMQAFLARKSSQPLPPQQQQHSTGKGKQPRIKSAPSQYSVTIKEQPDEEESEVNKELIPLARRISWAFEKPLVGRDKDITLSEMKALLRSQMRMKVESQVPPDFIYLTISTIQKSMARSETNYNTKANMQDLKPAAVTLRKRPNSSPSRIDPRTKVPVEELAMDMFNSEDGTVSEMSDHRSVRSLKTKEQPKTPCVPEKECFSTLCAVTPVIGPPRQSLHPRSVKSTVPPGRIIRPISAGPLGTERLNGQLSLFPSRPVTAPVNAAVKLRPTSVKSIPASIAPSLPGAGTFSQKPRPQALVSSAYSEASATPMLMYSKEVKDKASELKEQRKSRQPPMELGADGRPLGRVSAYNQPMRDHATFELRTHHQEEEHAAQIQQSYVDQKKKQERESERKKKAAWIAMATGKAKEVVKQGKSGKCVDSQLIE
ncbi:CMT1A duplicated region transcript 1 protein [Aplysia californica]|uniref:CMT1A duplicated region transcript 1 protein n=1 Tax=Aplysia californica TaxID=6500 RepID=A0ABM1VSI7_APLCA|nr:CMT1A duplicated region transcript 1 protein [Aplysia californica]